MRIHFETTVVHFEPRGLNFISAVSWTHFKLEH